MNFKLLKNIINILILFILCILHSIILLYSVTTEWFVFIFYIIITGITMMALLLEILDGFNVIKKE